MAQTWDATLRASGYRVTPQRQLVLEAVTKLNHASPEEIFAEVQQTAQGVNVSTIYRTLELLEQLGLVVNPPAMRTTAAPAINVPVTRMVLCTVGGPSCSLAASAPQVPTDAGRPGSAEIWSKWTRSRHDHKGPLSRKDCNLRGFPGTLPDRYLVRLSGAAGGVHGP